MADVAWISERVHMVSYPQMGERSDEPLCSMLTSVAEARTTSSATEVTCDACKAIDLAMSRGNSVRIKVGTTKKPVARLGVEIDVQTWETLKKIDDYPGTRPIGFFVDTSQSALWLVLAADSQDVLHRMHDISTKAGGLPMKSHGELTE